MTADVEVPPIRPVFRVLCGLISTATAGALLLMAVLIVMEPGATSSFDWVWAFLFGVTLAFAARYFGFFAFTGQPPKRAPRNPLRTMFDAAYGVIATIAILRFLAALGGTLGEKIWIATLVLIFANAMRRYFERGAASLRRRQTLSGR